ncbi:MAG: hypothetical protein EXR09_01640 [Acetobacteraceae bacterium]|nr:hypothetical protein [Acetobacteraceae bacterium]
MNIHGSCAARKGMGVLLTGPAGAGKSDLVLRLLAHGFSLVADDRVEVTGLLARPAPALAGLLEVRGLGIVRLPFLASAKLVMAVELTAIFTRLPQPARHPWLDIPLFHLDPSLASAPERVAMALDCTLGRAELMVEACAA